VSLSTAAVARSLTLAALALKKSTMPRMVDFWSG